MRTHGLLFPAFCLIFFAISGHATEPADVYYESAIRLHGESDLETVFEQYARSAELGHPVAQYNIAMMYSNGESVYVDYQQAVYWFTKSANQGFPPGQFRLGEMYYFEKGGLSRDLDMAIALFKMAADQNDPDAQMNLAMLHSTGEGLPKDKKTALYWIGKAEEGGYETAPQYREMLLASEDGQFSVEQQERYWIEKAAELGIREAQEALGMLNNGKEKKSGNQKN
jgi:TPR repeat protein